MGMAWGVQNMGMGESERRICRGNPCFSGFFSYNAHDSGAPEGEKMRGLAGALPGGAHKKRAQERIPEPLFRGVI